LLALSEMKINELLGDFEVYTTNQETQVLKKLYRPIKLATLSEQDQVTIAGLIRKSLVIKIGHTDPTVVINEKYQD
jgi:hypothetical protein